MSPSPSVQSTLLRDASTPLRDISTPLRDVSPIDLQTPRNDLFLPDSNYSDPIYRAPVTNRGVSPVDTSGIDMIRQVRSAVEKWTSDLGPVEDWPRIFRELYDEACLDTSSRTTQESIDVFLRQVGEHVRNGKEILSGLERCAVVSLPRAQCAEGDRLLAGDLMRTLHRGVALLEARLELHAPSGAQPSPLHSNICRHVEFVS